MQVFEVWHGTCELADDCRNAGQWVVADVQRLYIRQTILYLRVREGQLDFVGAEVEFFDSKSGECAP